MNEILQFPIEAVRTWRGIEQAFRTELRRNNIEPECQDQVIERIHSVYDAYCGMSVTMDDVPKTCMAPIEVVSTHYKNTIVNLLLQIVYLEVKLWRAGVRNGGPTKDAA